MCLILDANIVHRVFPKPARDFEPVHSAVTAGKARIVYGGYITTEYSRISWFIKLLRELDKQGRARHVDDNRVEARTQRLIASRVCQSDDPHVIALAQVSGVRLLCSLDNALGADFTNSGVLKRPRGKVYKRRSHRDLIPMHCSHTKGKSSPR